MRKLILFTFLLLSLSSQAQMFNVMMAQQGGRVTGGTPTGQTAYTSPGTYTWVCPTGVTSVCVVLVGGAGQGTTYQFAGGLTYKNNITVTPGNSYTIVVGQGSSTMANCRSTAFTLSVGNGNDRSAGDGGGDGGRSNNGGGGAGGYSGNGGAGGNPGQSGSGGAGGGGSIYNDTDLSINVVMGGGGVGILGQGSNGAGGTYSYGCTGCYDGSASGHGGSGGQDGNYSDGDPYGYGGLYGGGGDTYNGLVGGAVRIIWGTGRSFPSTNTGNL